MIISGVYLIENTTQHKYYIGSSVDINKRIKQHFSLLKHNKHSVRDMQEDYNNKDCFKSKVLKDLQSTVKSYLLNEEAKSIKEYSEKGILYNTLLIEHDHFMDKKVLEDHILEQYCLEHFGKTYRQLTSHTLSAEIEMLYKILIHPDDEEEIRDEYRSVIDYQNSLYHSFTHNRVRLMKAQENARMEVTQ